MKKNKLNLEKYTITKLSNLSKIRGGGPTDNGETEETFVCIELSTLWVKDPEETNNSETC